MANTTREQNQEAKRLLKKQLNGQSLTPGEQNSLAMTSRNSFNLDSKQQYQRQFDDAANRYGLEPPKPMYQAEQNKGSDNNYEYLPAPRPF